MTNFPRIIYYKLKNKTKKNKNKIRCFCKSKWKQILLLRLKDNIFVYVARKTILLQYTIVTLFLAGEGEQKCPTHITFLNNFLKKDSSITFLLGTWSWRSLILYLIRTHWSTIVFQKIISEFGLPLPLFSHGVTKKAKVIIVEADIIWYCWKITKNNILESFQWEITK